MVSHLLKCVLPQQFRLENAHNHGKLELLINLLTNLFCVIVLVIQTSIVKHTNTIEQVLGSTVDTHSKLNVLKTFT